MAQQALTIAAPDAEQMTKSLTGLAGAGITGVVEGVIIQLAPTLGALETPLTWGVLLGIPAIGTAGALFSRGMISDLMQGVASGGTAIAAFVLPGMLMPNLFAKKGSGGSRQLGSGAGVKQLGPGSGVGSRQSQHATSVMEI